MVGMDFNVLKSILEIDHCQPVSLPCHCHQPVSPLNLNLGTLKNLLMKCMLIGLNSSSSL